MNRLLFMFFLCSPSLSQGATVLVVESYHCEYEWVQSHTQGLKSALSDEHELIFFEMDTKRKPVSEHAKMAEAAWLAFQRASPDLVVLADDNALKYLAPRFKEVNVPVVYLGINANPRDYGVTASGQFYGVLERLLIKRSVLFLQEIMALDRVLLIFDGGTTSQAILREGFQSDPSVGLSNVHVEAVSVDTFGQWQKTVVNAKASGYDAMLVGLYHNFIDDQGVHISEDEVIKWTSVHSPVPAFSLWDYAVGKEKMIGGYVISGTRQGRLAAKMANRLLKLAKPSIMPDVTYSAEFIFSHTQLKKWGIALPEKISRVAEFVD